MMELVLKMTTMQWRAAMLLLQSLLRIVCHGLTASVLLTASHLVGYPATVNTM